MADFVGPMDPDVPRWASDLRGTLPTPSGQRDVSRIKRIIVHRAGGPGWPGSTEDLVRELCPHWPGQSTPYWAFVEPSGRVAVVTNLKDKGSHAASYNTSSLGVAVIGDFRKNTPSEAQRRALLRLLQWCCERFSFRAKDVYGHTELPGSTRTPGKECPGWMLDMNALRLDLADGRGIIL